MSSFGRGPGAALVSSQHCQAYSWSVRWTLNACLAGIWDWCVAQIVYKVYSLTNCTNNCIDTGGLPVGPTVEQ